MIKKIISGVDPETAPEAPWDRDGVNNMKGVRSTEAGGE